MANRITIQIAGQRYTLLAEESEEYMSEVAELAQQTIVACGGSSSFASTRALALAVVNLADEYIKAKRETRDAQARVRVVETEANALQEEIVRLQRAAVFSAESQPAEQTEAAVAAEIPAEKTEEMQCDAPVEEEKPVPQPAEQPIRQSAEAPLPQAETVATPAEQPKPQPVAAAAAKPAVTQEEAAKLAAQMLMKNKKKKGRRSAKHPAYKH